MVRDFTFIDDVVEGLLKCCYKKATKNESFDPLDVKPSSSLAPFRIFNLGNSNPIELMKFINILEEVIGLKAIKNFVEISPGDVIKTEANTSKLKNWINYEPQTDIYDGVCIFIKWYKSYYGLE